MTAKDANEWEPMVQYGFSRVPVVQKADTALYWVTVTLRLELERTKRKFGIAE